MKKLNDCILNLNGVIILSVSLAISILFFAVGVILDIKSIPFKVMVYVLFEITALASGLVENFAYFREDRNNLLILLSGSIFIYFSLYCLFTTVIIIFFESWLESLFVTLAISIISLILAGVISYCLKKKLKLFKDIKEEK